MKAFALLEAVFLKSRLHGSRQLVTICVSLSKIFKKNMGGCPWIFDF